MCGGQWSWLMWVSVEREVSVQWTGMLLPPDISGWVLGLSLECRLWVSEVCCCCCDSGDGWMWGNGARTLVGWFGVVAFGWALDLD